ncbi:hypothetical protein ACJJTC_017121, partial [Scirpophaga incertulas]
MQGSFKIQLINMGTRAAAFTAKIRSLYDCQLRLMHNIQPLPSGTDIANTVKYFSQTLLSVLKDVPRSPLEMLRDADNDADRMALYPNLDYKGLFNAISQLVDAAPHIQYGIQAFGQAVLQCLGCLLPFLEYDMIDNLPYLVAYCVAVFPVSLHQEILNLLCYYILPFTITRRYSGQEEESQASQSVAAIVMMVFQHSNNPAHHCQLLECLMSMKQTVVKDILCVIAYGTWGARLSAAKLLFYYWPPFDAKLFDRKGLLCKFSNDLVPFLCQRDMCPNAGSAEAAKVCYDHCISVTFASDTPPPLYLCIECANEIHREHPNQRFFDILHPQQQVSMVCENKNCRSTDKAAYSICFSNECASYNGNHPIRYCQQCHGNRHNSRRGGDHVVHTRLPHAWQMDSDMQTNLVEAIISLLKEAKPINMEDPDSLTEHLKPPLTVNLPDPISVDDRQLLGRYGVWLMVGLCTPNPDTPDEVLGRLLSVLFHWFHVTSFSYTGETANTVEKLKVEHVCGWVRSIVRSGRGVGVCCLLPHPPRHTRHAGHWDTLASKAHHLRDGLHRLYCLIPYGIITQTIWDYIMPAWMEAICTDVPEKELLELKVPLAKILEPDGTMVGVDERNLYNFAVLKVTDTPTPETVLPVLEWFQTISMLEVKIPLNQLFDLFSQCVVNLPEKIFKPASDGTKRDSSPNCAEKDKKEKDEQMKPQNLTCGILMLDILLKQMELQQRRINIQNVSSEATKLLRLMLKSNQANTIEHAACLAEGACSYCEAAALWHQLAVLLVRALAPDRPRHAQPSPEDSWPEPQSRKHAAEDERSRSGGTPGSSVDALMSLAHGVAAGAAPDKTSVGGVLVHMPHIMTATVETITEQLDMAAALPPDQPPIATAHTVTLTDTDVATATADVSTPNLLGDNECSADSAEDDMTNFWPTSAGKFHFCIEELPQELQYIHQLLQELKNTSRPDVLYHLLQCLQVLVLNADALADHRGFLIWCQENLLIDNVPVLLHCVTLPGGADVFCSLIRDQFHNQDSRVRFTAVERVTIIIRFMDGSPVKSSLPLQTALATAFCYLISSMDDINVYVAQRATLYIGTIHDKAIEMLLYCLETQFDLVIVDRPMVLQSIYQLHNTLSDRRILAWEFFLNRFEALFLEAQINSNKTVDFSNLRELVSSDTSSEWFLYKVRRAHEALSVSAREPAHSLSASFGTKWPYKRTISAPAAVPADPRHGECRRVGTAGTTASSALAERVLRHQVALQADHLCARRRARRPPPRGPTSGPSLRPPPCPPTPATVSAAAWAPRGPQRARHSLSASFGTKWPYKRTISAPAAVPADPRHGECRRVGTAGTTASSALAERVLRHQVALQADHLCARRRARRPPPRGPTSGPSLRPPPCPPTPATVSAAAWAPRGPQRARHSLSASFGTKWPYKRTISAPAAVPADPRHGECRRVGTAGTTASSALAERVLRHQVALQADHLCARRRARRPPPRGPTSGPSLRPPPCPPTPATVSAAAWAPRGPQRARHSLSASFGTKWPYKRTISAPAAVPADPRHGECRRVGTAGTTASSALAERVLRHQVALQADHLCARRRARRPPPRGPTSGPSLRPPTCPPTPATVSAAAWAPRGPQRARHSLSASFGTKWPYKRTISAPADPRHGECRRVGTAGTTASSALAERVLRHQVALQADHLCARRRARRPPPRGPTSGPSLRPPPCPPTPATVSAAAWAPRGPQRARHSLSASFGTKWPYKRTISAPAAVPADPRHGECRRVGTAGTTASSALAERVLRHQVALQADHLCARRRARRPPPR